MSKNFKTNLALVFLGIFIFLFLTEVGLRLSSYVLRSWRDNRAAEPVTGACRIICLGESTTAGGRYAYPWYLEHFLNQRIKSIRFQVINLGVDGTNTSEIYESLAGKLDRYHPDIVVTMMGINDRGYHIPADYRINAGKNFFKGLRVYKLGAYLGLRIATLVDRLQHSSGRGYRRWMERKKRGDFLGAERLLLEALELEPENAGINRELGSLYALQGAYERSERFYLRAIRFGHDWESYSGLGNLYRISLRKKEAEEAYKKAIELKPEEISNYKQLAWIYFS